MQTRRETSQQRLMLLPPLEAFVPKDHYLRRLDKVLDLSFVHEAVRDRYCQDNGRPSIDPEVVVRLFLIQAMEGIVHVRELMRQVQVNLAYRWFIGYSLEEELPDHSTLSRALDRFGDALFNELFERSIKACKKSGLIEGKVLHIDATTIRADIDRDKVGKPESSDPDARYGKFPGKNTAPGYKQHTLADDKSRVIVGVSVTPANIHEHDETLPLVDETLTRLESPPEALCGDAAYASGRNYNELKKRGIELISPPPKPRTYTGSSYFSVEEFEYDEENDLFVCPAGKKLKYLRTEEERGRRIYRGRLTHCRDCYLKSQCTGGKQRYLKVSSNHSGIVELRANSETESFKRLYAKRAPTIEGIFAEAKQWHGLRRAWRRGLSNMLVQSLLVATVLNYKRLVAALGPSSAAFWLLRRALKAIWRLAELISATILPTGEETACAS
jgi:transposase